MIEDPELRRQLAQTMPPLAALGQPRPAALPRIALFGATLAAALGLFWLAVDVGSGYVAPFVPYDLQRRLGESVAEDLIGRPAALPGARRAGGDQRAGHAAGQGGRLSASGQRAHREGRAGQRLHPAGRHPRLLFRPDRPRARRQRAGRRAGARDGSRHALSRDQGAGAAVRRRAAAEVDDRRLLRPRHASARAAACCWRCATAAASSATPTPPRWSCSRSSACAPTALRRFFERMLEKQPDDMASVIGIWSSHPPTAERIAATRRPPTGPPAFSDAQWAALQAVCGPQERLRHPIGPTGSHLLQCRQRTDSKSATGRSLCRLQ